jgi:hypothetical protein
LAILLLFVLAPKKTETKITNAGWQTLTSIFVFYVATIVCQKNIYIFAKAHTIQRTIIVSVGDSQLCLKRG